MSYYRFALVGQNIHYSKSPEIFERLLAHAGHSGECAVHDCLPSELPGVVAELKKNETTGWAVTIPHKTSIMKLLDEIESVAVKVGAVNSVHNRDGRLHGYNTDVSGFSLTLEPFAERLKEGDATILGSGGAAKAVVYSLREHFGMRRFLIIARTQAAGRELAERMSRIFNDLQCTVEQWGTAHHLDSAIIVNCTPLGGSNYQQDEPLGSHVNISKKSIYYDLNYNGGTIIGRLSSQGIQTIDGSSMLVAQAIDSFERWTGVRVPFGRVYSEVFGQKLG